MVTIIKPSSIILSPVGAERIRAYDSNLFREATTAVRHSCSEGHNDVENAVIPLDFYRTTYAQIIKIFAAILYGLPLGARFRMQN